MSGLYLHIPFCVQKCRYCAFYSVVNPLQLEAFVDALCSELIFRSRNEQFRSPQTVYFGGGTPSILSVSQLERIIHTIDQTMGLQDCEEMTLEVNPEHVSEIYLQGLKQVPIQRISMGVQSFDDRILQQLGRGHDARAAVEALDLLERYGFTHCSIDLIYGIPHQTEAIWRSTLAQAARCSIEHLSAYALTVEPKTMLFKDIQRGRMPSLDEEQQIAHYQILQHWCEREGFEPYETSSYARRGAYALHNRRYWDATPYLGCGPGAHSYEPPLRRWNSSDLSDYIVCAGQGTDVPWQSETLSPKDRYNEYVMLSIRTKWGVNQDWIRSNLGADWESIFLRQVSRIRPDYLQLQADQSWVCTAQGRLFADAMAVDLMAD